jgi:hypothetical protein
MMNLNRETRAICAAILAVGTLNSRGGGDRWDHCKEFFHVLEEWDEHEQEYQERMKRRLNA